MGYVAATALLAAAVFFALAEHHAWRALAARALSGIAGAALIGLLIGRSIRIGFPALTGTYEGLLLGVAVIATAIAAGPRLFGSETRIQSITAAGAFLAVVILSSPLVSADVHPPLPILRSAWLVVHVAFAFVGLALFTVAGVATLVGMVRAARSAGGSGGTAVAADGLRDRSIVTGFIFYATGGLVFGAIWAEAAWGRFWGWDPKETWALITTVVYAVYLHLRYVRKASETLLRITALLAWLVSVFTFFGVNYLMTGLHAYG